MQSVPESEEKIQILYTGNFDDDNMNEQFMLIEKHMRESMGVSAEFLTGDVHYSHFAEEAAQRHKARDKVALDQIHKVVGGFLCRAKRWHAGIGGKRRVKNIRAMRAGKDTCFRSSSTDRAARQESAKELSWIPADMLNPFPLW